MSTETQPDVETPSKTPPAMDETTVRHLHLGLKILGQPEEIDAVMDTIDTGGKGKEVTAQMEKVWGFHYMIGHTRDLGLVMAWEDVLHDHIARVGSIEGQGWTWLIEANQWAVQIRRAQSNGAE